MAVLGLILFAVWGLGQIFNWIFPGYGGKILFVTFFVLFPVGVALFGSSEARNAFFDKDEDD
jgi:hypothetical protein